MSYWPSEERNDRPDVDGDGPDGEEEGQFAPYSFQFHFLPSRGRSRSVAVGGLPQIFGSDAICILRPAQRTHAHRGQQFLIATRYFPRLGALTEKNMGSLSRQVMWLRNRDFPPYVVVGFRGTTRRTARREFPANTPRRKGRNEGHVIKFGSPFCRGRIFSRCH